MIRLLTTCLFVSIASLNAFTPQLNLISPRGGQRGTELEVHFRGERLEDVAEALFYEPGLTLSAIEVKDAKHVVAKLTISPDAQLGEHSLRLRGPSGLTEVRSFWISQFPTVSETEPNATFDTAQRVKLNQTIGGVADNEDDDYYVVSLKKGQRLSVELEAMRLGRTFFDAYVAILDPKNFELASCDDTPLLRNDPYASIIAPEDGDYRILVHEAAYEGNKQCQYRLHIGTFPRPTAVFPCGGKPGETLEFTFIGDPAGPIQQRIKLPAKPVDRFPIFPLQKGQSAPSPHWITVSPLESVTATTPNPFLKAAIAAPAIPFAANGILTEKHGWFSFSAKKGQNLVFRVLARSLRSPLDSVLSIHQKDGKSLTNNDDQGAPDSIINWSCPADGTYFLRIRDQLNRTGPDFTYRIEVAEKSPSIAANLPTVERVKSQKWKTFPVPRGNRYAALVNISRQNTACDSAFSAGSLPAGVKLHSPPIPRSITNFPIVLEAAVDAPLAGGLYPFSLKSTGDAPQLTGKLVDTIHHVDINNQGPYHSVSLDRIATAVTIEAPFHIDLVQPPVPIVKNGTLALKLKVTRAKGFKEKIVARLLWKPPGVSGPVTIDIPGDKSEASYELNANNDAAIADWQVCVLGEANTKQGPVVVSTSLVPLKVADPFVSMTLDLAATEQGKNTAMLAKLEVLQPFDGEATVEMFGLPHGATTKAAKITQDSTELTFPITVAADAAVGKHNGVFCRVKIPQNGNTISHQVAAGGTLRIDKPAPAQVAKADPASGKKPASKKPADAKPLSRLEQLRQRAK